MPSIGFATKIAAAAPDAIAPDGSEVCVLCATARGSMAQFTLPPRAVSRAVTHRTVEELWYVAAGRGRIWRKSARCDAVTALAAGTSLSIPIGTWFQFRNDGEEALVIVGVTMPPWPGDDEAHPVEGKWPASL